MSTNVPEGQALIPGRSRDNARAALDAAEAAGLDPQVAVRTVQDGYLVPVAVLEHYKAPEGADEPVTADAAAEDDGTGGEPGEAIDGVNAGEVESTEGSEEVLQAPAKSASKGDWVAFAVEASADSDSPLTEEEAQALTKDELIERFGA
jgi:hypothetical protein